MADQPPEADEPESTRAKTAANKCMSGLVVKLLAGMLGIRQSWRDVAGVHTDLHENGH